MATIAIAVIAVAGLRSATSLIANDEEVAHTHEVRGKLSELLVQLVNAETGQRGFVITGNEEFLEPYNSAINAVDAAYAEVRRLTFDNPAHTRRLDAVRPSIDAKLAELKKRVELRRTVGFEPAAASIARGEGKRLMKVIRASLDEIDQEETALLELRRRRAAASTEDTKLVILWGGVAAIAFTIVIGWLITSSLSKQIGSAVQHVQTSSTELHAAATQQASGAREQATAMTEISVTLEQLLATSRQIADGAKRVSQVAGLTATAAHDGEVTVTKGRDATATVRRQVDLAIGHMSELVTRSRQIDAVLEIVAELAEQTNILAINAAIEAAGAGASGERFGVVADEIRKLADRVGASTKEIRGMVEGVRGAAHTTVMATEAGSNAVDLGTTQVDEMATAFQQIAGLVGATQNAAKEIELSTAQQATAVEQVHLAIAMAAGATRETEASASQTLQTASQLTALSSSLVKIVEASGERVD